MAGTTSSSTFDDPRSARGGRDVTWYGTVVLLAACLGLVATVFFAG